MTFEQALEMALSSSRARARRNGLVLLAVGVLIGVGFSLAGELRWSGLIVALGLAGLGLATLARHRRCGRPALHTG